MSKWDIPFIANVPVEKELEFNEKIRTELVYEKEKDTRIGKTFHNLSSNLRKVADYLNQHQDEELSYIQISEELGIPKSSVVGYIAELNYYKGFSQTMIPVLKKAGFIQPVLRNEEHYEKWDRKKMKTLTSMSAVKDKAEKIVGSKKKVRKSIKKKVNLQLKGGLKYE